jgi:YhcH/YjgK/YiaL family protein
MKKIIFFFIGMTFSVTGFYATAQTNAQVNEWYQKKEWLGGVQLQPHETINKTIFAKQYQLNKSYWDKAFAFLKSHDLETLAVGRYDIDGDNVYAMVTENPTKDMDSTKWESHYNYLDLHLVIRGEEKIGIAPVSKLVVTMAYDASKDLANYSGEGKFYIASPGTFFLFFPGEAHRPNITTNGNKPDKKLVIKIRYTQ